jgi:D-alanine-D-alanine ligase
VGEIAVKDGFYSYEAKYLDASAAELHLVADLDDAVRERIRSLAVKAFGVLGCRGLARVDFFLAHDGRLYVNELNTMPGFTRISMYPKLWELEGLSNERLVERLVALALE